LKDSFETEDFNFIQDIDRTDYKDDHVFERKKKRNPDDFYHEIEDDDEYEDVDDYRDDDYDYSDRDYDDYDEDYRRPAGRSRSKSSGTRPARRKAVAPRRTRAAVRPAKPRKKSQESFFSKIADSIENMNTVDHILVLTGVIVLFIAIVTGVYYAGVKMTGDQIEEFETIGNNLNEVSAMGESTLLAVTENYVARLDEMEMYGDGSMESEDTNPDELVEKKEAESGPDTITLNLTSVEKDLKIKFVNKKNGKLIKNIAFKVEVKTPSGSTETYTNDDKDGIIYKKDVTPGEYAVSLVDIDEIKEFEYSTSPVTVTVKDHIEYKKVDVAAEVKTEAEVNVAKEDTTKKEAESAPVVKDTVDWVESTKTATGNDGEDANDGTNSYVKVDKADIPDPATTADAGIMPFGLRYGGAFAYFAVTGGDDSCEHTFGEWQTTKEATCTEKGEKERLCSKCEAKDTESISKKDHEWGEFDDNGVAKCKNCGEEKTDSSKAKHTHDYQKDKTVEPTCTEKGYTVYKCKNSGCDEPEIKKDEKEAKGHTKATKKENGKEIEYCTVCNEVISENELQASIEGLEISGRSTFKVGDTETITAKAKGSDLKDNSISFTEKSNGGVVKVESNSGSTLKLKGLKPGTAVFALKYDDGKTSKSDEIKITVEDTQALSISVNYQTLPIPVGEKGYIKVTVSGGRPSYTYEFKADQADYLKLYSEKETTSDTSFELKIKRLDNENNKNDAKTVTVTVKVTDADGKSQNTSVKITKADPASDKTTKLKDKDGNQLYVKDDDTDQIREAVLADYYKYKRFFKKNTNVTYSYTGWQTIDEKTYFFDKKGKKVTGDQVIKGVKYSFDSDGVLKSTGGVGGAGVGIDVSKWNGSVNWDKVKANGVQYAIVRLGYRGSSTGALIQDPKFKSNLSGAKNAGLKVGVYFFTQAVNEVEAVEEASMVLNLLGGTGLNYPVYLDVESSGGRGDSLDKATRTKVINAFCKTIQNGGYKAGVYANKTWLESKISTGSLNTGSVWLAQYAEKPTYGGKYTMWQYTSKGQINGISGYVDMNIAY